MTLHRPFLTNLNPPSPSMAACQKRQADRVKGRIERDADIRQSLKAGATLADLGRKYQITMDRERQIARNKPRMRLHSGVTRAYNAPMSRGDLITIRCCLQSMPRLQ